MLSVSRYCLDLVIMFCGSKCGSNVFDSGGGRLACGHEMGESVSPRPPLRQGLHSAALWGSRSRPRSVFGYSSQPLGQLPW